MKSFKEYMKVMEAERAKPQIFLDMDGVLADFFGELWTMYQETNTKEDAWEDLNRELSPAKQNKLVQSIENPIDFFANLDVLEGGQILIDWLRKNNIPFSILSAPMKGNKKSDSIEGKTEWLKRHGLGSVPATFTADKQDYAMSNGVSNILIDDFGKNITAWKKQGGIGIKYDDANDVIGQLHQILGVQ